MSYITTGRCAGCGAKEGEPHEPPAGFGAAIDEPMCANQWASHMRRQAEDRSNTIRDRDREIEEIRRGLEHRKGRRG